MEIEFFDDDDGPDAISPNSANRDLEDLAFLVIDDSGVQRKFIKNALVDFGAQNIIETKDAVDGLSVLRDNRQHVDMVLVDQEMPIFDGTQFTQMVRNDVSMPNSDIPIIMVTSRTSHSHISEAKKAGIDSYVAKPFTPEILRSHVIAVLEKRALPTPVPAAKQTLRERVVKDHDLKNLRCLVIDDSEFTRKLICRSLRSIDIKDILQAADAVDGLSILREKFQHIDVIFVDREMPIFDGVEFTRMVRHDEALNESYTPIVMVSGLVDPHHILDAKNAGVSAFVSKPFSTHDIEHHLRLVLNDPHTFVQAKEYGQS